MSQLTALDALARIPDWSDGNTSVREQLGGSDTNLSWLVERHGMRYVLRIDTPRATSLGLDRQREVAIRESVSRAGLAPRVVYRDLAAGILLSDYATGRAWTYDDMHDAANLRQLADRLRILHALPVVGSPADLSASLLRYAAELGDGASMARASDAIGQLDQVSAYTPVLCHNDLVAQNLVAGEQLWLIDWEYAGAGNRLFDLAVVIEHHGLPPALWQPFAQLCMGSISERQQRDLTRYRSVYRTLVALWGAVE